MYNIRCGHRGIGLRPQILYVYVLSLRDISYHISLCCCNLQQNSTSWMLINYRDTRASIVILHARRCVNCCAGMLWLRSRQALRSGCHIHNSTYLTLSLTWTITLTLLTLTVTVRVILTLATLLTLILGTVLNTAPAFQGLLMSVQALIHVLFKTSKKRTVTGLGRKGNIGLRILQILQFHFGLT